MENRFRFGCFSSRQWIFTVKVPKSHKLQRFEDTSEECECNQQVSNTKTHLDNPQRIIKQRLRLMQNLELVNIHQQNRPKNYLDSSLSSSLSEKCIIRIYSDWLNVSNEIKTVRSRWMIFNLFSTKFRKKSTDNFYVTSTNFTLWMRLVTCWHDNGREFRSILITWVRLWNSKTYRFIYSPDWSSRTTRMASIYFYTIPRLCTHKS